ncbi:GNAT family N-acetyltransferase [Kribbia dieselivorans]|uniref:GNAT family N-acetyltransferase n=1 Tax=Kribbia dieselivorans TaxID=331526 RepID=UPI0008382A20|nr:GNAT family N-acetyltransferase [Kribbia dieselivorans]
MTEINVRTLTENEWELFRSIRLAALKDSPEAFVATYEDESAIAETEWRERMNRSPRLLAEVDGEPVGVVSVGHSTRRDDATMGELFGLWVTPEWRGRSVAANLVVTGAKFATEKGLKQLAYWVGSDNGRAVAFASSFGFRPTDERRPMRNREDETEIMLVLALGADRGTTRNHRNG